MLWSEVKFKFSELNRIFKDRDVEWTHCSVTISTTHPFSIHVITEVFESSVEYITACVHLCVCVNKCVKANKPPPAPPTTLYLSLQRHCKCNAIVSPSGRVNYFWKQSFFSCRDVWQQSQLSGHSAFWPRLQCSSAFLLQQAHTKSHNV